MCIMEKRSKVGRSVSQGLACHWIGPLWSNTIYNLVVWLSLRNRYWDGTWALQWSSSRQAGWECPAHLQGSEKLVVAEGHTHIESRSNCCVNSLWRTAQNSAPVHEWMRPNMTSHSQPTLSDLPQCSSKQY